MHSGPPVYLAIYITRCHRQEVKLSSSFTRKGSGRGTTHQQLDLVEKFCCAVMRKVRRVCLFASDKRGNSEQNE